MKEKINARYELNQAVPNVKAITTDKSIPEIIARALAELIYLPRSAIAIGGIEDFYKRNCYCSSQAIQKLLKQLLRWVDPNVLNVSSKYNICYHDRKENDHDLGKIEFVQGGKHRNVQFPSSRWKMWHQ
ncbi:MAG: hypothetical protein MZV63_10965 [Marinilabiliales bacterium]|nr:hypothetical protein [Marinilabiliales bacterium]